MTLPTFVRVTLLTPLAALWLANGANAEVLVPRLLKDINRSSVPLDSDPREFAEVEGKAVFSADQFMPSGHDHFRIPQIWQSDGTAAGTIEVPKPLPYLGNWDPRKSVSFGGSRYFGATLNDVPGLWKSDGTAQGTTSVGNLGVPAFGSVPENLTVAGGLLYFTIGTRVWRSDGTSGGTFPVGPIPENSNTFQSVAGFTVAGESVYFIADRNTIWRSAGSPETTAKVFGGGRVTIKDPVAFNGGLAFIAEYSPAVSGPVGPYVLMKTGGSLESTVVIGGDDSTTWKTPGDLVAWNGSLYFSARDPISGDELWKSDGTTAGTAMVKDIEPGEEGYTRVIAVTPGWMYLETWTLAHGGELWRSDGTAAGTYLLKDLLKGAASGLWLGDCVLVGDKLFFQGKGKKDADTLCVSDGTAKGTRVLKTFPAGTFDDDYPTLGRAGNLCIFGAGELWRSDGTPKGTVMVKDIAFRNGDSVFTDSLDSSSHAEVIGGSYIFSAADKNSNHELWKSDGTTKGTTLLKDTAKPPGEGWPDRFAKIGDRLYFRANNRTWDNFAWSTDGTPKGTRLEPGMQSVSYPELDDQISFGGQTYFLGESSLYRHQGPGQAPILVADGVVNGREVKPQLAVTNGAIFLCDDGMGGLLRSDGTAAGTVQVKALSATDFSSAFHFRDPVVMGNALYFLGSGREDAGLWRSDGSTAKTIRIFANPNPTQWAESWTHLTLAGGRLYWYVIIQDDQQLWTSDGTSEGATMLKSLSYDFPSFEKFETEPMVFGDRIIFVVNDVAHGRELWISDGTPEGTKILKDIWPGRRSGWPENFHSAAGLLFFTATDGIHGTELWRTDGTEAGTVMVADLWPGELSSAPQGIRSTASGKLFFAALTPDIGCEPWVLDLPAAPVLTAGPVTRLAMVSGPTSAGESSADGDQALLAYAFNVPAGPAAVVPMIPGSGTAGYPSVTTCGQVLRVEYLRRKNAGLAYTPKCSTSLVADSFMPMSGKVTVTVIDPEWDRVVVEQPYDSATTPRLFALVEVTEGK